MKSVMNLYTGFKHHISKIKPLQKEPTPMLPTIDNPWFYCSLCEKFLEYTELIDGCKCAYCDNDMFIVPWNEYEDLLSEQFCDGTPLIPNITVRDYKIDSI